MNRKTCTSFFDLKHKQFTEPENSNKGHGNTSVQLLINYTILYAQCSAVYIHLFDKASTYL